MKAVWKFELPKPGSFALVEMPSGARFLHVAIQDGTPMLWAEVYPGMHPQTRKIWCFGTGWEIPENCYHFGTVIDSDGFVWHFYFEPMVPST